MKRFKNRIERLERDLARAPMFVIGIRRRGESAQACLERVLAERGMTVADLGPLDYTLVMGFWRDRETYPYPDRDSTSQRRDFRDHRPE